MAHPVQVETDALLIRLPVGRGFDGLAGLSSAAPFLLSGSLHRWGVRGSLSPCRGSRPPCILSPLSWALLLCPGRGGPVGAQPLPQPHLLPPSSPAPHPGPCGHLREAVCTLRPGALWCGARPSRGEGGSLWAQRGGLEISVKVRREERLPGCME